MSDGVYLAAGANMLENQLAVDGDLDDNNLLSTITLTNSCGSSFRSPINLSANDGRY